MFFCYEKIHTNLLTEIFFPVAFCNIYPLFSPLSHSKVERRRHWQVTTVTPFNLLSLFKRLFRDYFIHLPFTLSSKFQFVSMLSVYHFFWKAFIKDLLKYVALEVSFELKNFRLFFDLFTFPEQTMSGRESRQEQKNKHKKRKNILDQNPIGSHLLCLVIMSL